GVWVHRIVPSDQRRRGTPRLPDLPQNIRDYTLTAFDEVVRIHSTRGLDVVSSPIWDLEGVACIASRLVPSVLSLHSTYKFVLRKGTDLLLDVLPEILAEFPTLEAVLVGCNDFPVSDGPLKDRFEARYAGEPFLERIRFTGVLPAADLEREYARCDLFVAPS